MKDVLPSSWISKKETVIVNENRLSCLFFLGEKKHECIKERLEIIQRTHW